MHRSPLILVAALGLGSLATAQQDASAKILPAPVAKDAGVYHLATGTWTRAKSPVAMIGTDVLYDNTCSSGLYFGLSSGETLVDSGRLPSTGSPSTGTSLTGTANNYDIDGLQYAYCTGEPTIDVTVNHYVQYDPCADATALIPDSTINAVGLPGVAGGTGSFNCWVVTLDLDLTSQQFNLLADADGTYDGTASLDNFGWSFEITTNPISGIAQGPFIAGDPFGLSTGVACPYGDGTFWSGNTNPGTGIGSDDTFETDLGGVMNGCWFFGGYLSGNPYSSFHHQVIGDASGAPTVTGTQYCAADGSGAACPCGNNNDGSINGGLAGCANGVAGTGSGGAVLDGSGNPSVSGDTVVLTASNVQAGQPGIFFRADNATSGGAGIPFGDGLRCAGGNLLRFPVQIEGGASDPDGTQDGNISSNAAMGGGLSAGDIRRYQYWYRNPLNSPCAAAFNLTNGFEITWTL